MCRAEGWSPQEKGKLYLSVSLRGNAQGVLGNLPGADQRDYNALCIALEQRFAPTNQTELYRAQLREKAKSCRNFARASPRFKEIYKFDNPNSNGRSKGNSDK